jgi:hypothetical protein
MLSVSVQGRRRARRGHLFGSAVIRVLRDGGGHLSKQRERTLLQVRLNHIPVRSHPLQFLAIVSTQRLVPERVLVKGGRRILRIVIVFGFRGSAPGGLSLRRSTLLLSRWRTGLLIFFVFVRVDRINFLALRGVIIFLDMVRHGINSPSSVAWHDK